MGNGSDIARFVALTFAISWLAWEPVVAFGREPSLGAPQSSPGAGVRAGTPAP